MGEVIAFNIEKKLIALNLQLIAFNIENNNNNNNNNKDMTISTTIQLKIAITILEGHPSGGSNGNGSGGCGGGSGCDVYYSGYIILLYCLYYFIVLKAKIKSLMLGVL